MSNQYKHKNNNGSLFKNDNKRPDKNDPDYKGSAVIDGQEYWISGWKKESSDKKSNFLSLSFSPKEEQANSGNRKSRRDEPDDDF